MGIRWISYRRKDELQLLSAEFGLSLVGTVEELRSRLATFLTREDLEPALQDRANELAATFPEAATPRDKSPSPLGGQEPREQKINTPGIDSGSTSLRLEVPPGSRPAMNTNSDSPAREEISSAALAEKLRNWGISFNGRTDPLTFVERLEVQAEAYRLSTARLHRVISGLLTGKAESWYRTFQMQDVTWEIFRREFLEFFLPPQYFQRLEDTIRTRYQRPDESCKEYVVNLRLLMQRAKFTPAQELERLYENLRPEYQLFVRRQDFEDLATLIQRATAYEITRDRDRALHVNYLAAMPHRQARRFQAPPPPTGSTGDQLGFSSTPATNRMLVQVPEHPIDVRNACRRCGEPGHFSEGSSNPQVLFCWEGRIVATVTIEGKTFHATLDTGASRSFISAKVANDIGSADNRRDVRTKISLADGSTTDVTHALTTTVTLGRDTAKTTLLVLSSILDEIILGIDFLCGIKTTIQCGKAQLSLSYDSPPPTNRSQPPTVTPRQPLDNRRPDYRQLNAHSVPDAYPLPRIGHILERLRNAKFISTLDLKSGYWQIPVAPDSRACTAFTVPGRGLFQWKVMPFGLHSAPATFQRALDSVIGPDMEPHAFAYLDDIIVIGTSLDEHFTNLREVLRRLRQANLKLNKAKCKFFQHSITYLGHVISEDGIHTDPDKIAAVRELKPPTNCKELRRCLGIASWYRRFVENFATIVQPMSALLRKGRKWTWSDPQQQAFEDLKKKLTEALVLACPDFNLRFQLQTDASDFGLGAVLTQQVDGTERVIAYASRRLLAAEENYSATEKECLAIVWAIRKMRCYLEGYRFDVITDHLALKWLNSIDNPTGRIARWALEVQQFQFDICYRRGQQNVVADACPGNP
ncbi:uncharacterized protein [Drosophila takahashii]|uniref:uncharacterized protein n=1 Tax=Drosophila takahashii TaxID=29030 RepID=UPI0038994F2C